MGADLFGVEAPAQRTTCFGAALDVLARDRGCWPAEAIVYAVSVVNDRTAIQMEGGIPAGWDSKGWPKFPKKGATYLSVVPMADYRVAAAEPSLPNHVKEMKR